VFGCRHGRFSIQPHKICLGVGIDGSVHNRTRYVLGVDMDASVHNPTNLKKVTQAYFCQEKWASPWSREGVWRSVHRFSTQPHKICFGCLEVSTPIQYTTAQDMFGCRHRWFSTQPHKPCESYPGSGGQYTDEPLKKALIQNPIQYTS
jgi:hypothetical protein